MLPFPRAWLALAAGGAAAAVVVLQSNAEAQKKDDTTRVVAEQAPDFWRASKLIGVGIVDLTGEKLGSISEVLIDHDGIARVVVIDVGGFLGIGRKSIGVPFDALKWVSHEDAAPATYNASPKKSPLGAIVALPQKKRATDAGSGYPDRAILSLTKAQLKDAPDFQYARNGIFTTKTPFGPAGPLNTPAGPAAPQ